ncbi:hypothetical protein ACFE04_017225 [Oxalis oulophora]
MPQREDKGKKKGNYVVRRKTGKDVPPRVGFWYMVSSISYMLRKVKAFYNECCCDAFDDPMFTGKQVALATTYFSTPGRSLGRLRIDHLRGRSLGRLRISRYIVIPSHVWVCRSGHGTISDGQKPFRKSPKKTIFLSDRGTRLKFALPSNKGNPYLTSFREVAD